MKLVIKWLVVLAVFGWRWSSVKPLLPKTWQANDMVKYRVVLRDEPEYTDSQTVIRTGRWKIVLWGYQPLKVGWEYEFKGKVQVREKLGKQVAVVMKGASFEVVSKRGQMSRLIKWREQWVKMLERWLPEPHASLSAGILLGVKREMPSEFYQQLVKTGTLHIVAASGYNVTIVAEVIMELLVKVVARGWALVGGISGIIAYVIMAGASPAVVRSGIMAVLTLLVFYWGRVVEVKRVLWVAVGLMLWVQPLMLVDVGFQLSVMATVGLLYLEPRLEKWWLEWMKQMEWWREGGWLSRVNQFLSEFWWTTISATIATTPVIYFTFGRMSWISPVVNLLVLPLTPLIMLLSAVAIGVGSLIFGMGQMVAWVLYVPLEWMVKVIEWF